MGSTSFGGKVLLAFVVTALLLAVCTNIGLGIW